MKESSIHPSKIVIAHRGASGYLPEHTLPAKALAYAMGADFLEQDVVLSRDGVPVVLHDIHLDTVTDVADRYPDRARKDGRFYVIDFSLGELKTLRVTERFDIKTGQRVYPNRFPGHKSDFRIATLAEEIELIQGLNSSTSGEVGLYPEIKKPAWHREQGQDISRIVIDQLMHYGYNDKSDHLYLQCFDAVETQRIREELDCHMSIIQLIGENSWGEASTDYSHMRTAEGLEHVARYADGIGPSMNHVVRAADNRTGYEITDLVEHAHERSLEVHPYTLRADALPPYVDGFERLVEIALFEADTDGVFSDFPDLTVKVRNQLIQPIQ